MSNKSYVARMYAASGLRHIGRDTMLRIIGPAAIWCNMALWTWPPMQSRCGICVISLFAGEDIRVAGCRDGPCGKT